MPTNTGDFLALLGMLTIAAHVAYQAPRRIIPSEHLRRVGGWWAVRG